MKSIVLTVAFAAIAAFADATERFVAPDFVKELKDLDAVKKAAATKGKGITFLLMEPGST